MGIAIQMAMRSKDRSTKVGAAFVAPGNELLAVGYNGLPRGCDDDVPERHESPEKYFWYEHAEKNGIINAARVGVALKGCRAYVSFTPCMECARALVSVGTKEIVISRMIHDMYFGKNPQSRWAEDFKRLETLLTEAGVTLRWMTEPLLPMTLTLNGVTIGIDQAFHSPD